MSKKFKKKIFAIFVEGEEGNGEEFYFSELNQQQWVRDSKYKLKVVSCKGINKLLEDKAFKGQHEGKSFSENKYDKVAFVLDCDKKNISKNKLNKLLNMDYIIGFSNPKIELWFLAHFEEIQLSYSDVEKSLKNHIPDYHKKKKHPKIVGLAKSCDQAISNVGNKNTPSYDNVCTSVGKVIQEIRN